MTRKPVSLKNVLTSEPTVTVEADNFNFEALKRAGRVWLEEKVSQMRKLELVKAMNTAFKKNGKCVAATVTKEQLSVLEVIARHGTHIAGCLLTAELKARGISTERDRYGYRTSPAKGPAEALEQRLVLIPERDYWSGGRQPEVFMPAVIRKEITPAEPIPWPTNDLAISSKATSTGFRSTAEVQLDFWAVHEHLENQGAWKPLKGGGLPKSMRNRLKKALKLQSAEDDVMQLPDPEAFYYELMCGVGIVEVDEYEAVVGDGKKYLDMDPAHFIWHLTRSWLHRRLWQDGIGAVPDRDSEYEPVRIDPTYLVPSRILLTWGLQRLAHSEAADWVGLESFLTKLYQAIEGDGFKFYWGGHYTWMPGYKLGKEKDKHTAKKRSLAYWLDDEGVWASNAIMISLHALGLIERGTCMKQPCFRLTQLGRLVFGAPEIEEIVEPSTRQFLVVQPNFDVTVYLREMDGRDLQQILPFLTRTSTTGGEVQGFRLERERVYQALEEGLSLEEIRERLRTHAREAIPQVVERALAEWSGKRESLTLRRNIGIVFAKSGNLAKAREVRPGCLLVASAAATLKKRFPKATGHDHSKRPSGGAFVDEEGVVTFPKSALPDTITKVRLRTLAKAAKTHWLITDETIKHAASLGIPSSQSIAWLRDMLQEDLTPPALLRTAICNWSKAPTSFFGNLCAVQIADGSAYRAVCHAEPFQDLIVGVIEPDWILFHPEKAELTQDLLEAYGFNLSGTPKVAAPSSTERPGINDLIAQLAPRTSKQKPAKRKMPRKRRSSRRRPL